MTHARAILLYGGLVVASLRAVASGAAEPDYGADLPRIPQVPPAAAAATMRVQPGFALDLVHEPLVASPVAIAWDEDGRLFVAEMRGYSEQRGENLGRIRMLHDDDRDGPYDRATIFADRLGWPTAVVVSHGGLFVGDAPDILRLVDTDHEGVADVRQTVFTGIGTGNVQGLFNSFAVGLDNRVHGAGSSVGGAIRRVDAVGRPVGEAVSIAGGIRAAGSWACPATGPAWLTTRLVPSWGQRQGTRILSQDLGQDLGRVSPTATGDS
jgi:hypothetical protein